MSDDWQSEYHSALHGGPGLGIGGLLGEQERQRRERDKEYWDNQRNYRDARKNKDSQATIGVEGASHHGLAPGERVFPKFIAFLSYPLIAFGMGFGFWLTQNLGSWWPAAGTIFGGAVGFAVPRVGYLIVMAIAYGVLELLEWLLNLLVVVVRIALVLALGYGAVMAFLHFYG